MRRGIDVVNKEQIEAMLERRGYIPHPGTLTGYDEDDQQLSAPVRVLYVPVALGHVCKNPYCYAGFHPLGTYQDLQRFSRNDLMQLIDVALGMGHHHVQCQCGMPLLTVKCIDSLHLLDMTAGIAGHDVEIMFQEESSHHEYRTVVDGHRSALLTQCPRCGVQLSGQSTKEIVDDE